MIVVVAKNGARGLMLSERDRRAIAAAGPGRNDWAPTWYAFDVEGPGLDFHGVPATLEAAVEARRKMVEREPAMGCNHVAHSQRQGGIGSQSANDRWSDCRAPDRPRMEGDQD